MVIESFITPMKAEKRPWQMMLLGVFYSSVAIMFSYIISPNNSSMLMVFFTVMACMPIIYNTIKYEESKDEKGLSEVRLLKEHYRALEVFIFLFLGITLSFSVWNIVLPESISLNLFSAQFETMQSVNANATSMSGRFFGIFMNNLEVLFWCTAFSFLYGLGAIFILTWNASVIGFAIAKFIKSNLANLAQQLGAVSTAGYIQIYSCGYFVRYLPHGLLEIAAYFMAGLAGGILSVAVIRHRLGTKGFMDIVFDSADLLLISFIVIFIAGLVEVFMTPGFVGLVC
ncbi:stage II sporulation protein M [Candidatus Woesearchaeota archaeon]|nr:stage II sporulation protein M [Candidatus Woesearchaeota archaeon]